MTTDTDDVAKLAASLGHLPNERPEWRADTSRPPIPITRWGMDHWSTFVYIEARAVDHRGVLVHDQLRCHGARHPIMGAAKRQGHNDASRYPTRLKDAEEPAEDGKFGITELADHDDYDCIDDMIAAGLLEVRMPTVGAGGCFVDAAYGQPVRKPEGDTIRPAFMTGLDELWLATAAAFVLTDRGRSIAAQLRAWKSRGGNWHQFVPDLPAQDDQTPATAGEPSP